ncbi:MAG: hypothetical protein BGO67_10795 [Alphaproteobacteria bacterium 41-28]|nr:MAG: hypothetical protein BGO67_10795 [Alphaproteobacteria bacterium 41-28]
MNQDMCKGKWIKIKGSLKKTWRNASNDDFKEQNDKIIELVREIYGEAKKVIEKEDSRLS